MSKKKEFQQNGVTKLAFSFEALEPIRQLYYQIMSDRLDPSVDIGIKAHEDYSDEFNEVIMRWYFAKSLAALKIFRVGCSRSPQSHSGLCSWGFTRLPPTSNLKYFRYRCLLT